MKRRNLQIEDKKNNFPTILTSFFLFNILLLCIGIAYVGIGGWLFSILQSKPNVSALTYYYSSLGSIIIAVGILVVLSSVYGVVVAFVKNFYASLVYLMLLIISILFGVSAGIVGLTYSAAVPDQISQVLNFNYFNSTLNQLNIANIQNSYQCCGVNLPNDWQVFGLGGGLCPLNGSPLCPLACCSTFDENKQCSAIFQNGCFNVIQDIISTDMSIIGGLTLAIALPIFIGIISTIARVVEQREKKNGIPYKMTQ